MRGGGGGFEQSRGEDMRVHSSPVGIMVPGVMIFLYPALSLSHYGILGRSQRHGCKAPPVCVALTIPVVRPPPPPRWKQRGCRVVSESPVMYGNNNP